MRGVAVWMHLGAGEEVAPSRVNVALVSVRAHAGDTHEGGGCTATLLGGGGVFK